MNIKIVAPFLVAITLIFSGCDNEAESRMETQQMVDSGDYSSVISSLEDKGDSRTDTENIQLATSYMGAAGYETTSMISMILDASEGNVSDDEFENFKSAVLGDGEDINATLENLAKATEIYKSLQDENSTMVKENKLKIALTYTIRTAIMIDQIDENSTSYTKDIEEVVVVANEAFEFLIFAAPDDVKEDAEKLKYDVMIKDGDPSGTITVADIEAYTGVSL